ncbi:hypothetical protein BpHYR1_054303 [Brachionus plicatilis]|uniref:Uncharacterized protein n=1 Tax=Brachionus plicatilis TaxID=10195 RepID=A0A3M7QU65_BRAPC|nr:hypothetical protein BpHYR1_054303 [Brachionus plicatilis]
MIYEGFKLFCLCCKLLENQSSESYFKYFCGQELDKKHLNEYKYKNWLEQPLIGFKTEFCTNFHGQAIGNLILYKRKN